MMFERSDDQMDVKLQADNSDRVSRSGLTGLGNV
jgi:hypothetical protein